jgi:hypothetical protein
MTRSRHDQTCACITLDFQMRKLLTEWDKELISAIVTFVSPMSWQPESLCTTWLFAATTGQPLGGLSHNALSYQKGTYNEILLWTKPLATFCPRFCIRAALLKGPKWSNSRKLIIKFAADKRHSSVLKPIILRMREQRININHV